MKFTSLLMILIFSFGVVAPSASAAICRTEMVWVIDSEGYWEWTEYGSYWVAPTGHYEEQLVCEEECRIEIVCGWEAVGYWVWAGGEWIWVQEYRWQCDERQVCS